MELVITAVSAPDENMLQALRDGEDLHTKTAAAITGKRIEEVTKEERKGAKAVNFGFNYGQKAEGFIDFAREQYDLVFSLYEAARLRNIYFATYPGIQAWHDRARAEADNPNLDSVRTASGRIIWLLNGWWAKFVAQTNYVIQGSCADIIKRSMILINAQLDSSARLIHCVHDELIVECPTIQAEEVKRAMKRIMIEATHHYFPDAPMQVDARIAQTWKKPD
jgi:DNA polymerase I-like protein with 3'-5' exonuclease and polymerase domains